MPSRKPYRNIIGGDSGATLYHKHYRYIVPSTRNDFERTPAFICVT